MNDSARPDWYRMDAVRCFAELDASAEGLSSADAADRLRRFGPNDLKPAAIPGAWRRLARQLNNDLLLILLAAGALTAVLGHFVDAAVIVGVVMIIAAVGFVQEGRAEQTMRAIRQMLRFRVVVVRREQTAEIDAAKLVPGDIVIIQAGDRVPADARLLESRHLEADQSSLTGESEPSAKNAATISGDAALPDRGNLLYAGTLITRGQGKALVVATGERTELGQVAGALRAVHRLSTPLLDRISDFARTISFFILALAGAIALFGGLVRGYPAAEMLLAAVSIAVAAIPEGLPPVITITLAVSVQLMGRRNAIVRRMPAVETLGEVDVILTDKTGTLTANEITVRSVVLADSRHETTGIGFQTAGRLESCGDADAKNSPVLRRLLRAALNCGDAQIQIGENGYRVRGDPTECALAVLAAKGGTDCARLRRIDVLPFESETRFMATLHPDGDSANMIFVKGAPEAVVAMCARAQTADGATDINRRQWLEEAARLAAKGERVLALAEMTVSSDTNALTSGLLDGQLDLLGLVGSMDPPRPEVRAALKRCRSAGVRVKMVTGDHADTAAAIGGQLGLTEDGGVITGEELDKLNEKEFAAAAESAAVFARTSPQHKLRLVAALQANGHTVAMTGDGINDAPALKRSDVGVAMGMKGTHAAQDAAEIVLTDDNFATIVRAVDAGRNIYENIKKSVLFFMPTNLTEALVIALAILAGQQLPMTPVQILWINMITAVTLGIALAFEPENPALMTRSPRAARSPLLTPAVVWRTVFVSALMLAAIAWLFSREAESGGVEYARTAAVTLLVMFEAVYLISSRHPNGNSASLEGWFGNRIAAGLIVAVVLLQILFIYAPPFNFLFASRPLSVDTWLRIAALAAALFAVVELEKSAHRLFPAPKPE